MYMYIRELYTQRSKRPLGWEQDAEVSPNTLVLFVCMYVYVYTRTQYSKNQATTGLGAGCRVVAEYTSSTSSLCLQRLEQLGWEQDAAVSPNTLVH
jgi:hypothetical protein